MIKYFIILIFLLFSSISYGNNYSFLLNEYIKDDIKKFLYLTYERTNPYIVYDIFHKNNLRKYLNCYILKKHHNGTSNNINIENVNINILNKVVNLSGYVLVNNERIDINYKIFMDFPYIIQNMPISSENRRYKILYVINFDDDNYCLIK